MMYIYQHHGPKLTWQTYNWLQCDLTEVAKIHVYANEAEFVKDICPNIYLRCEVVSANVISFTGRWAIAIVAIIQALYGTSPDLPPDIR